MKTGTLYLLLSALLLFLIGCKKNGNASAATAFTDSIAIVDLGSVQQTIRGFGGSSAWLGALTDDEMNTLYGNANDSQFGLNILRVRIDPSGSSAWGPELSNAQKVIALGSIVMATPWSPPASMKSNNSTTGGGTLNNSSYSDYANYLSSYVTYMASNGAPLYAISVQNEPDFSATYESCTWSPAAILNFVKNYPPAIGNTKLIASESYHFSHAYTDPMLNDTTAATHLSIVGGHIYGGGLAPYPLAADMSKEVWMTEHEDTTTDWAGALNTAKEINDCMTIGNFNVYLFWWLRQSWGLIDENDNPTKRGYAIAQFAKYVRPGCQRVTTSSNPAGNIYFSAYKSGTSIVIVALNMGNTTASQPFSITGGPAPASFTPHITSAGLNISPSQNTAVIDGRFTYTLPAQSITTFVSN